MSNRLIRAFIAICGLGWTLQFFGCLNSGFARRVVIDGVAHEAFEFLLDNNAIFDLFTDGG